MTLIELEVRARTVLSLIMLISTSRMSQRLRQVVFRMQETIKAHRPDIAGTQQPSRSNAGYRTPGLREE